MVVVDSGSTDLRREIAQIAGAQVWTQEFRGYGRQKQFALEKADCDWLLLSWTLTSGWTTRPGAPTTALHAHPPESVNGYRLRSAPSTWAGGLSTASGWNEAELRRRGWGRPLETGRRSRVAGADGRPQQVDSRQDPGRPVQDLGHHLEKIDRYTEIIAVRDQDTPSPRVWLGHGRGAAACSSTSTSCRSVSWDGLRGFLGASLMAFYFFLRYAKIWERKRGREGRRPGDPEAIASRRGAIRAGGAQRMVSHIRSISSTRKRGPALKQTSARSVTSTSTRSSGKFATRAARTSTRQSASPVKPSGPGRKRHSTSRARRRRPALSGKGRPQRLLTGTRRRCERGPSGPPSGESSTRPSKHRVRRKRRSTRGALRPSIHRLGTVGSGGCQRKERVRWRMDRTVTPAWNSLLAGRRPRRRSRGTAGRSRSPARGHAARYRCRSRRAPPGRWGLRSQFSFASRRSLHGPATVPETAPSWRALPCRSPGRPAPSPSAVSRRQSPPQTTPGRR